MIKAVIFDFFGVLSTEGFRLFCDTYFPGDKQKRSRAIELVTNHDAGFVSKAQYADGLAKLAGVSLKVVNDHMSDNTPNDLLLSYIKKELKPRYKIGVLSNSGDDYMSQILDPSDIEIFDDVILSYRHGMVKPQIEIFELAAKRLGLITTDCLFVDDSQSHIEGARRAGMRTILYKNFPNFKKQIETSLSPVSDN